MRSDDFRATVTALWSALELGAPRMEDDAEVILTIDDMSIALADSPDERQLVLSAKAGQLHENYGMRAGQVRALLRKGLAFLLVSRACILLRRTDNIGLTVVVEATYSYARGGLADLVKIIHEVVYVLESVKDELAPTGASARGKGGLPADSGDSVIFFT